LKISGESEETSEDSAGFSDEFKETFVHSEGSEETLQFYDES
jgi:hypothetical protein